MGYKRKAKTFTLVFDGDAEYEGLEIEAKSLPMGDFLDVSALFSKENQTDQDVIAVIGAFTKSLVRWNLEDDNDQPVPLTLEGVRTMDLDFILAVIAAWLTGMAGTPGELGKDSPSGTTSLEASMLTEGL